MIKKFLSILLVFILITPVSAFCVFAERGTATVSVELYSIGSGALVPPTKVEVTGNERASEVLMELIASNGYTCYYGGEPSSSFYLAYIADGSKTARYNGYKCSASLYPVSSPRSLNIRSDIPEKMKNFLRANADFFDENDYEDNFRGYIGEFVFSNGSGWMYCLNGDYTQRDLGSVYLRPGDTLKLQFTLYLGVDLGGADAATQQLYNKWAAENETTTVPETTSAVPETTTKAPETTTAAPSSTCAPETTSKAPEETSAVKNEEEPQSVTAAPEKETEASIEEEPSETAFSEETTQTADETELPEESSTEEVSEVQSVLSEETEASEKNVPSDESEGEKKSIPPVIITVFAAAAVVAISAGVVIIIKKKKGVTHNEN